MGVFQKLGCSLIGWDEKILKQCGEASYRQFRKLTSAIFIMMVLWGTIGYCFSDNYINIQSTLFKVIIALIFVAIIVCIERVIILTVGKATIMGGIRILLAIVMATLGSTVFDQMIFRNDIKEQLDINREETIQQIVAQRVKLIDDRVSSIRLDMDSLSREIADASEKVMKNPVIKSVNVSTNRTNTGQLDAEGKPIIATTTSTQQVTLANPLTEQLKSDQEIYTKYMTQIEGLNKDKLNIQETVADEVLSRKPGFIEELQATVDVVSKSGWTIAFYLLMFCFLLLLETFVVSIKMADTKCDYDLVVEHQLRIREMQLKSAEQNVTDKYVTKQMPNSDKDINV